MNYLWQQFNIKTFPAETIVYRNGIFDPSLSSLESEVIDKKYDLPIHIIYLGEITGDNQLNINLSIPDQNVFLTVKTENKTPAFLNILIKNAGQGSWIKGKILIYNQSALNIHINAYHLVKNTGVLIETKLVASAKSQTNIIGCAYLNKDCPGCDSNVSLSALAVPDASVEFSPSQKINAVPSSADHSASLYKGTPHQIIFLREAGLSGAEIKEVLEEAFAGDFLVF